MPMVLVVLSAKQEHHLTAWIEETKPEKALSIFNMSKAKRYQMQNKAKGIKSLYTSMKTLMKWGKILSKYLYY